MARRHKVGSRGAALVEAAFIFPMFIILFFGALYFHNAWFKKFDVIAQARSESWAYAMSACGKNGEDNTEKFSGVKANKGTLTMTDTVNNNMVSQLAGGGFTGFLSGLGSYISSLPIFLNPEAADSAHSGTVDYRQRDIYDKTVANSTTTLNYEAVVVCNIDPANGNLWEVVKMIFGWVKGMFGSWG
jgi:hypothetical protein